LDGWQPADPGFRRHLTALVIGIMGTRTITPTRHKDHPTGVRVVADQYIEAQLNRTRRDVKLVDLSGSLMVLSAAVFGILLILAVVDHWILALSVWARWAMLSGIAVAVAWYFVRAVLPLLISQVNPIYAARTIEQSEPSLKNSLVNYLMFRDDRAGLRAGIYEALKQQAASDLTHVPVESAVDRTRLIRVGYVLAAILALFAAYTILSPKSPLQTARRVMLPWADIAPPTRVRIEDVRPGNQQVYHSDQVTISALCYDLRADEPVTLFYSSEDGRISDQPVRMIRRDAGLVYEGVVPAGDEGIQQDLIYRIEAGDARTGSYRLTVVPAPALLVQQIEYEYPGYTRQPNRTVERQGDVRGIEGTRVTIRARANHPIRWATIVLDPPAPRNNAADSALGASPDNGAAELISMQFDGQQAWGSFLLELHPDGQRPKHSTYLLRFETESGQTNSRAPVYRIEVIRDLSPEIEILTPSRQRIELPVDRRLPIEIRAIDPDFGLTGIQMRAVAGGDDLLTETLLEDSEGRIGQVVTNYELEPWMHGLRPGDTLTFWAVASDNRVSARTGQPAPNVARTPGYQVTILPPENTGPGLEPTLADPEDDPSAQPQQPGEPPTGDADSEPSSVLVDRPDSPAQPEAEQGESADGADAQQGGQAGAAGENEASAESGPSTSNGGEPGPSSPDTEAGGQNDTGAGSGDGGSTGSEPGDTRGPSPGGQGPSPAGEDLGESDGDGEPLHDGEVIERALEHLRSQPSASSPDQATDHQHSAPSEETAGGMEQPGGTQPLDDGQAPDDSGLGADDHGSDEGQQQDGEAGEPGEAGGEPQGPEAAQPDSTQPDSADGDPKQGGMGDDGQSGAGQAGQDESGAPASLDENLDRPKQGDAADGPQQPGEEPPAPSQSTHQSDSQAEGQGDESGGGEQGGGQGSQQQGSDSSGSQSPADQGSDAAPQSGAGDPSQRPGDQQPADDPTGAPGMQPGDGSSSKPVPGEQGPGTPAQDASETQADQQPSGQPAPDETGQPGQGLPTGGDRPGPTDGMGTEMSGEVPARDDPNLDYAKRATDLVLEYLRDQQQKPDPELLERLRWTEDDLRNFLRRWEDLQRAAGEDPRGQQDWSDALRSLGLRPDQQTTRRVTAPADPVQGLRETGGQSSPPAKYLEQFNAYKKGTARVDE
jgi:hypothetical protein